MVAASGQREDITPQAGKMVKMVNVLPCVFYHNRQRKGRKMRRKRKGERRKEGRKETKRVHLLLGMLTSQMEMVPRVLCVIQAFRKFSALVRL